MYLLGMFIIFMYVLYNFNVHVSCVTDNFIKIKMILIFSLWILSEFMT